MQTPPRENGVELEVQRIEQDFAAQRISLRAQSQQFAEWQAGWTQRQEEIDASLAQLKARLGSAVDQLPGSGLLKLYSRDDLPHERDA